MRGLIIAAALLAPSIALAQGQHWVNGYYKSDGTYVQPHMQTNPDGNPYNNWTTRGNVNPYTGQPGYRDPNPLGYAPVPVPQYQQPDPYSPHPGAITPGYGGGINPNGGGALPQRTCGYGGCF